jgi:hypothetical protein
VTINGPFIQGAIAVAPAIWLAIAVSRRSDLVRDRVQVTDPQIAE